MTQEQKEFCEELWRTEYRQILTICALKLDSCGKEDAEDAALEAFEAFCIALESDKEMKHPRQWLYSYAALKIKRLNKENALKKGAVLSIQSGDIDEEELAYVYTYKNDDDKAFEDDFIEILAVNVLKELTFTERKIFNLYYRKCRRLPQIAEILGMSHQAVKQHHYRVKKKIKKFVKVNIDKLT